MTTDVDWRPIPGATGYEVNAEGRVRSHRRRWTGGPRLLAQPVASDGYPTVALYCDDGKRRWKAVHALVLLAFRGPRPEGMEVRHLDGNPLNSRLPNLAYGTRSENMLDKARHGTEPWSNRTHCNSGHELVADNVRYETKTNGQRVRRCKECHRASQARYLARRMGAS